MGHQDKPRNGKDGSQDLSGKAYGAAILAPRVKGRVPESILQTRAGALLARFREPEELLGSQDKGANGGVVKSAY